MNLEINDDDSKRAKVTNVDNHIFYVGPINYDGASEFQKKVFEYVNKCTEKCIKKDKENDKEDDKSLEKNNEPCKPLNIHITSGGGNVASGISMMNAVEQANDKIDTKCISQGFVGSAATYAAFACKERCAAANTLFLLHPPSKSGISGQTDDVQVSAENLKRTHNNILDIYQRKTRCPKKFKSIRKNFEDNRYSSAIDMLDFGLIDEIYK